jgi:hypothetical protein
VCDPVSIVGGITAAIGAFSAQSQASNARQARNQAEAARLADRKAAEDAASAATSSSLIRNRRQRQQTLLGGVGSETLGGGMAVKPASRTLLGYGASQPSMYSVT